MTSDDLPMISQPTDGTEIELSLQKEVQVNAPEPRRNPTTQVPKPASAEIPPPKPVGRVDAPTVSIPPGAAGDPRKASEARRPGSVAPARPMNDPSASRPAAPAVKAPVPAAASEDEDPEKLLREYAERQKTKVVRLEQQVAEYKKVVAERDSLRAKVDALGKELQDAKRQIEVAEKSDEVIQDLQGKVDAAILSNSILADDKEKLKKGLSQQTDHLKKAEERAVQAEKSLADAQSQLAEQTAGREESEARVAAALEALQGEGAAPAAEAPAARPAQKPLSEAVTRPMAPVPPPKASDEKSPAAPAPAKPPAPQQRPPGRFSFLKK
jgi:peptidoglycan hydrolase CwlO-like protein